MKKHAIIGASGLVGENLFRVLQASDVDVNGTSNKQEIQGLDQLDIKSSVDVQNYINMTKPAYIYLPAALTNVEYCETNPEESYGSNVLGVENVVRACNQIGAKLIFFSSDYIFDGRNGPYPEDATANPISVYGIHKLIAEHYITAFCQDFIIVRTTVVYGWERQLKNFVGQLISTLREGITFNTPIDQIGSPTYAPNLAAAVLKLALSSYHGIINLAGADLISKYEFACEAAKAFDLDPALVTPVTTAKLKQLALRPLNAGMTTMKANAMQTYLLGYKEGLKEMSNTARNYCES
ncbi:MAG: SDR family oxidoreductase [Deltaproteobacteria bacterium]|nr:SDR family oxidoreductase [Deltaproteobacteria bacterium]